MKISILNGTPQQDAFDQYLHAIQHILEKAGHQVKHFTLRDLGLKYCIGCWGCWVKTPGRCDLDPQSQIMDREVISSDFVLLAAPLIMGLPSELLKMGQDKCLPLIHPYMEVVHGEAHHLKRYDRYPRVGVLVAKEESTDEEDLKIVTQLFQRASLNMKSGLVFSLTSDTSADKVAALITDQTLPFMRLPAKPIPTSGQAITPPASLTLFNGSPRGEKGNSPIFLNQFAKGFGGAISQYNLINVNNTAQHVEAFSKADCVWLGFPLYVDSMPAIVKHFVEALEPLAGRPNNPPIGFVVQSGFPEGLHSRYIEQYLKKLAKRLGCPYLGAIVKGNGEAVRLMPDQMNARLFNNLQALGACLARGEALDPAIVKRIATPEKFPLIFWPLFKLFVKLPIAHGYFDAMLKENGAYENRFDQPFAGNIK